MTSATFAAVMAITRATSVACFVLVSAAAPPPLNVPVVVVVVFIQAGPEPKYYFIMPKEVAMSTRKGHALPFSTAAALRQFSLFLSLAFHFSASAQSSHNFAEFSISLSFSPRILNCVLPANCFY